MCSVMVGVFVLSVINWGLKDYEIGICCFSAKHAVKRSKSRLVDLECVSGATCLPATVVSVTQSRH